VKGRRVLEGGIQELDIKTGRVLFEWHSIDHVSTRGVVLRSRGIRDGSSTTSMSTSIEIGSRRQLARVCRNTHTIYKISRRTGKTLAARRQAKRLHAGLNVRFAWQHDAGVGRTAL